MSQFIIDRYAEMKPYRLGAQPKDRTYIKLNSNETVMPPAPGVLAVLKDAGLRQDHGHYSDQDATVLREAVAARYGLSPEEVFCGNGADEILSFCFQAYCDDAVGLCCPDITYGFYTTFCRAYGVDLKKIPLDDQFQIRPEDYYEAGRTIVIANPNAPTGQRLSTEEIEEILKRNPKNIVIIDEAYVDFETETCIPLIRTYPNLIVVHTMSKSQNVAGLHVGYAVGQTELMEELNCLKNCFNPNNINQVTLDAAVAAMEDLEYTKQCCAEKVKIRRWFQGQLEALGFFVVPSYTNFVFVTHDKIAAADLEKRLKDDGILTRYYREPRIDAFLRITIGSWDEMEYVVHSLRAILQTPA